MLDRIGASFKDYAPLVIRLGLGWVFLIAGAQKLFGLFGGPGLSGFADSLAGMGFAPPMLWAILAAVTEFLGGLFVLAGFWTRYAAAGLACVMLVAIFKVNGIASVADARRGMLAFVCLAMCVSLFFSGGGRASMDLRIKMKKET